MYPFFDESCVDESQDECEERDSIQEAHETKKACDRKRYKADFESKKDSTNSLVPRPMFSQQRMDYITATRSGEMPNKSRSEHHLMLRNQIGAKLRHTGLEYVSVITSWCPFFR